MPFPNLGPLLLLVPLVYWIFLLEMWKWHDSQSITCRHNYIQPFLIYLLASSWTPLGMPVFLEKHTVLSDTQPAHPCYYALTLKFIPSLGKEKMRQEGRCGLKKKNSEEKNGKQPEKRRRGIKNISKNKWKDKIRQSRASVT